LAERNLAPYGGRVTLLREALWYEAAILGFTSAAREDSGTVCREVASTGVECWGIDPLRLLEVGNADEIDLFKIDIEGAEGMLFAYDPDPWIERTNAIVMEIHGDDAKRIIYDAIGRHPFRSWRHRDLHVFVRQRTNAASVLS
jgi:hypothetical protein